MWRDPRDGNNDLFHVSCPHCKGSCQELYIEKNSLISHRKCEICNNIKRIFRCLTCGSFVDICPTSSMHRNFKQNEKSHIESKTGIQEENSNSFFNYSTLISVVGLFVVLIAWFYMHKSVGPLENDNIVSINKLKNDYPSQTKETWYNFLGVLEKQFPSVKSIIFLHGKDKETSDCLINELVLLYTRNKNVKNEEITFTEFDAEDYGFFLEHYHAVVQKFRVFITDLNKVSGNVARMFHSLCDEVSSDIKPSLFIFTLKYNETEKPLKPIEKATSVLRESWSDLPESELFPLLSRVVKNVVEIVPEHQLNCKLKN